MRLTLALSISSVIACGACNDPPLPPAPPPPPIASVPASAAAIAPTSSAAGDATARADRGPEPVGKVSASPPKLPGATGAVTTDYLVYEPKKNRVWVPVGETGSVDVFDIAAGSFSMVDDYKKEERVTGDRHRFMGPSAVTIGAGFAYIGNRATSEVCAIDLETLTKGTCLKLTVPTDGVLYVDATKEVWVTTPRDHSIAVLDVSTPAKPVKKAVIRTEGEVEGYAVDAVHGLFFTNLEDKDKTLAIDVKTHAIKQSVPAGCGEKGPRGIALDPNRSLVFVACTNKVKVLDFAHGLSNVATIDTGDGVDNIDYYAGTNLLVVASSRSAKILFAEIDEHGQATKIERRDTADGARNAVVDGGGTAYLVDPKNATLVIVSRP